MARAFGDLDPATGRKPAGLSGVPALSMQPLQPGDEFILIRATAAAATIASSPAPPADTDADADADADAGVDASASSPAAAPAPPEDASMPAAPAEGSWHAGAASAHAGRLMPASATLTQKKGLQPWPWPTI